MNVEHLVEMANDITRFFDSELGPDEAYKGVALHISKFWDRRMRRAIDAHVAAGGEGLLPSALAAVRSLAANAA